MCGVRITTSTRKGLASGIRVPPRGCGDPCSVTPITFDRGAARAAQARHREATRDHAPAFASYEGSGRSTWVEAHAAGRELTLARDLYQVAARVIEHGRGVRLHLDRLLREPDPQRAQSVVLGFHVVDGERRVGNAVIDERLLEGLGGR